MPETALPLFVDELPLGYVDELSRWTRSAQAVLIIGVPERVVEQNETRYYNSAVTIGTSSGQTSHTQKLVPFAAFTPSQPLLGWVLDFLTIPLPDFMLVPAPHSTVDGAVKIGI